MTQTALDFTRCPCCGEIEAFGVHSDERLYGQCPITLKLGEGTELEASFFGVTDIYWDTTTTVGYFADCCSESLPDEYQDELDRLLNNSRERDENWQ